MEKSIKEIATELQVDKQKIYRFIKSNSISAVNQNTSKRNSVKYYDEQAINLIRAHFLNRKDEGLNHNINQSTSHSTSYDVLLKQIEVLQKQLEIKDKQISELHILLNQEQQKQIPYKNEDIEKSFENHLNENNKKPWFLRIFKSKR